MNFARGKYTNPQLAEAAKTLVTHLTNRGVDEKEIAQNIGITAAQLSQGISPMTSSFRLTSAYCVLYGVQLAYNIRLEEVYVSGNNDKKFVVIEDEELSPTVIIQQENDAIVEAVKTVTHTQFETFKDSITQLFQEYLPKATLPENHETPVIYRGHYKTYWLTVSNERTVRKRYTLFIHKTGAMIEYGTVKVEGLVEYRGNCLYINFEDKNNQEKKRSLILYVGTEQPPVYISGLYLTTNENSDIVAGPMLFVRQMENKIDDLAVVERFFYIYYPSERDKNFYFKGVSDTKILHTLQAPNSITRLENLKGKWFIYVWAEELKSQKDIFRATMEIKNPTHIVVRGEDDLYSGVVELCGISSNNFILRINYNNRIARIIGHIGNLNWQTITWIPSALCITSLTDDLPKVGLAVIQRCKEEDEFEQRYYEITDFAPNHPVYQGLAIGSGVKNLIAPNVLRDDR
jgi:hypothetical protein